MGVLLSYLEVDFIEGFHVFALIVDLYEISIRIILAKLAQECSELDSFISIFDEFQ
jgi:hypothetical protein